MQQRHADLQREGDRRDTPPVEAVGDRPGERQQQQRRCELDEAEQAEGERAVGDVVDVLGQGGGLQGDGDRRGRLGDEKGGDPTIADDLASRRRVGRGGRCRRHGRRGYGRSGAVDSGNRLVDRREHLQVGLRIRSEEVADLAEVMGDDELLTLALEVIGELVEHAHGSDVDEGDRLGIEDNTPRAWDLRRVP